VFFPSTSAGGPAGADFFAVAARQRFVAALFASIVLHALVLWSGLRAPHAPKLAQPLVATLQSVVPPPPAAAKPEPPPPAPEPPSKRPKPPAAPNVVATPVPAKPVERPPVPAQIAAEPKPADTDSDRSKAVVVAAPSVAHEPAPLALPPVAAPPPIAGIDPDGLRQYRVALASSARVFRAYPRIAQERGWTGTVELKIAVFADGRPHSVQVARSSGHSVLDNQARDMMNQALKQTAIPESLRGKDVAVTVPVNFDLREE
jgi:protein TonB